MVQLAVLKDERSVTGNRDLAAVVGDAEQYRLAILNFERHIVNAFLSTVELGYIRRAAHHFEVHRIHPGVALLLGRARVEALAVPAYQHALNCELPKVFLP